jgi:predicted unusual protein kinase regulating ubiquinone biosynthesis (AarF/ABC1/UbiB family)
VDRQTGGVPLTTDRIRRTGRLLSLPAGSLAAAAGGAVQRLAGGDAEAIRARQRDANAARMRLVLGDLKGGALKAGQLLSTVEALFPPDPEGTWRQALTGLQEDNPPLPFSEIAPVLRAELGEDWRGLFGDLETEAVAAASLGQVHRATAADGTPLAVKVQYPGIREALTADLGALAAMLRLSSLVARGVAMPPLVAELRTRLIAELDYRAEGAAQRAFAAAYRDDDEVCVPDVHLATDRVLVTDWLDGTPLARLGSAPQAVRNRTGAAYQRFFLASPGRVGLLHTDPHPGNFRLTDDGRLGVLDFGSVLGLPHGMPASFGRLIRVLQSDDPAAIESGLRAAGFVRPGQRPDVVKLRDYLAPFSEPARHEVFAFSREWLRGQFGRINDPRNPDFAVALQLNLPAEHLFTHRVWLGIVGVLSQLEATVPVRGEVARYLPGFADDPATG